MMAAVLRLPLINHSTESSGKPLTSISSIKRLKRIRQMISPRSPLKSNTPIQRMNPVSRLLISLQEPCIIITGLMTIRSPVSSMKRSRWRLIISKVHRNELVNPSLLRPIHLRVASSFSGRTYSLMYTPEFVVF
jgi:hypothetical protein